jgi:hypothetical protein
VNPDNDSSQHRPKYRVSPERRIHAACQKPHRFVLTSISLLALAVGSLLTVASVASAEVSGLPPGAPAPAWTAGKPVHFYPRPSQRAAVLAAAESNDRLSPQLAQPLATKVCPNNAKLCYWGGPVQHEPELFIIFWGEAFQQGPPATQELTTLRDFYLGLEEGKGEAGETTWQYILSQYYDNEGPGMVKAKVKTIFDKPTIPGELTNGQVETAITELVESEREKGIEPTAESQFIVIPQPGTNYEKFEEIACGFHDVDGEGHSYSVIPYAEDVGCVEPKGEGALAETSGTAAHEFAEATTDPLIEEPGKNYTSTVGWAKEDPPKIEVADLCETIPAEKPKNEAWWVVQLWDIKDGNMCRLEDPPYPPPPAPSATTGTAANIEENTANLEGTVNPNGPDAHYYFEYGTTTSYGSSSPAPPGNDAGFGESTVPASTVLSSLTPNTLYHYRLVAQSWAGTTKGEDKTFRTRAWKIQTTQNPGGSAETDEFRGVSCWSATGCDAVGINQNSEGEIAGLVEHWNGSTWEVQFTPKSTGAKEDNLESVACRSASECEATGYAEVAEGRHVTLAERWNGTAWSVQSTPATKGDDTNLVSVSCASASECVASGFSLPSSGIKAALAELWNGKEWKILTTATLPKEDEESWFESISCPSSKHCTAVGGVDTTLHGILPLAESWNGSKWTVQSTPVPESSNEAQLDGVSCSAASACTAVAGITTRQKKAIGR